ncbi:hypothetical protein FNH05_02090 [Amycolatopsis rhizosphaerae]|uniref:AttH domain-containing protein n=1 Tax=Amycolatopsis rhizosphaerae TaxID=2053003 RepID=A0A558DLF6_9PSEU|nr:hypothetical protein [Amycolatopsis rhizosphaerae]TVT61814.1 hypothetical protein FNH05_02090 [Amycolatopsis rhizosphaerae]
MKLRHNGVVAMIAAAALSLFFLPPAAAQDLVPPPTDITGSDLTQVPGHLAQPADDVAHPGSATEWWYVHLMDPRTGRTFIALFFTSPAPITAMFYYPENGPKAVLPVAATPTTASTATPSAGNSAGSIDYDPVRGAYHFVFHANGFDVDAWLDQPVTGLTGGPIRYDGGQEMYWTSPVATSHPTGHLRTPDGQDTDLAGWRGYHDHNWGSFNVVDQRYSGWEWAVSHEPDGSASLLGGVVKGDGVWQGVVAHATPDAVIGCMATLRLSDWRVSGAYSYPASENASCTDAKKGTPTGWEPEPYPGLDYTFHVTDPFVLDSGLLALPESVGRTGPGSIGLVEHIRTLPSRLGGGQ